MSLLDYIALILILWPLRACRVEQSINYLNKIKIIVVRDLREDNASNVGNGMQVK